MQFTIESIVELVRYFAPGLIFLYIFRYITNKEEKFQIDGNNFIVIILISYIVISIYYSGLSMFFDKTYFVEGEYLSLLDAGLVAVVVIFAFVCGMIRNSQKFEKYVIEKLFKRIFSDNVWECMKDMDGGSLVTLFKKNGEYIYGILSTFFCGRKRNLLCSFSVYKV